MRIVAPVTLAIFNTFCLIILNYRGNFETRNGSWIGQGVVVGSKE